MRSLNYSDGMVGLVYTNHPIYNRIDYAWTESEFESDFNVSLANYDKIIYEPDSNMYFIMNTNSTELQSFNDPSEHSALQLIESHFDYALSVAIRNILRETTDPYYEMGLAEAKATKINNFKQEFFIYSAESYDTSILTHLSIVAQMPSTPAAAKLAILDIAEWIVSVDKYYFEVIDTINAATNATEFLSATWDFTTFDSTKPDVSIRQIIVAL